MKFFHVTAQENLQAILRDGLNARTCFISEKWPDMLAYYKETIEDEGRVPVVIEVDQSHLEDVHPGILEPDWGGIEEPLTHTLGMRENEVQDRWKNSARDWSACVELMGTCRCTVAIGPWLVKQAGQAKAIYP